MKALDRKLLRDLWKMKGQALAIILVIVSGVRWRCCCCCCCCLMLLGVIVIVIVIVIEVTAFCQRTPLLCSLGFVWQCR